MLILKIRMLYDIFLMPQKTMLAITATITIMIITITIAIKNQQNQLVIL